MQSISSAIADDLAWEDVDSEYALTFFGKEALKIC
jgi:hypothetical protein